MKCKISKRLLCSIVGLIGGLLITHLGYSQASSDTARVLVVGKVMQENNQPLSAVTVSVLKGSNATITDNEGRYSISVSLNDMLVFSYVGYETQTLKPTLKDALDVVMIGNQGSMNEIVIVGFGKQKKVTVTGSVATITTKDLLQSPVSNLTNALAGRLLD